MDVPVSPSTDLVISKSATPTQNKLEVWPESLNTPGVLPRHLKREASSQYPLLEILQRLLYRLRPDTHNDLDKVLAAIALYSAVVPVYKHLKDLALWALTVEITIPEHDSVGFRPYLFDRVGGTSSRQVSGNPVDTSGRLTNALTITTLGWNLAPLQDFVVNCRAWKKANMIGTTTVYFAGGSSFDYGSGQWQSISKPIRKLDTIDMEETIKLDVIRDAEYYYSEQSKQFFADCGIPYRRGYLFHGPPGTGKTSFSAALAGHLGCDIYQINLASGDITDGKLHNLFLGLPQKCVVIIEDIDSAGIGREISSEEKQAAADAEEAESFMPSRFRVRGSRSNGPGRVGRCLVTLSGLLNAIDGNASQEGRLLIMTSNDPDALDAALTRPGRIDKRVYFGNMNKSAGKSIFKRLIGRAALAHDSVFSMADIEQYADRFVEKVPAHTFTPAQVQNYLQGCRGDPIMAVAGIEAWVAENRPDVAGSSSSPLSNATMVEAEEAQEVTL
ncbi:hypothetical protein N0V94_001573 [Neodidymelliopsis sp. IMI 364377]|nr:hypothetical protein N0V94_001573 [Neodidymelliopsis sp. IMI 364377]